MAADIVVEAVLQAVVAKFTNVYVLVMLVN